MMPVYTPGLEWYVNKLRDGECFSFARYENGEWDCILELWSRTASGSQRFTPSLRKALTISLTEKHKEAHYPAMTPDYLARIKMLPRIERWLIENAPNLDWHYGTVFHRSSEYGKLYPLVKALKDRHTVVVGPSWLRKLPFVNDFVAVNPKDCWTQIDQIEEQLHKFNNVVISFSAGPAAKVLIHRLAPILGQHSWLIDFGSLWDPYCGVRSRKYHRVLTTNILHRNLGI